MVTARRWALPLVAAAALLVAGAAPAGALGSVGAGHPGATAALSNHLISGTETSVSCMTLARCVAVGAGPRGGQVVSLYNGRQVGVTVLRYRSALTSVSCPSKAGCWAIGPTGAGITGVILVKVGPTGNVVTTRRVALPSGDELTQIGCRSMTACQILGHNNDEENLLLFFTPWNGTRWRLDSFGIGDTGSTVAGFSCWQTTCVVIGWNQFNSVNGETYAWTFHDGVAGAINYKGPESTTLTAGHQTSFSAVSCVSAKTCYAVGISFLAGIAVTISDGVPSATNEPMPFVPRALACVRTTCWASRENQIVRLTDGVVSGTPLTDTATVKFDGITAHGSGFIAIGEATRPGETDLLFG